MSLTIVIVTHEADVTTEAGKKGKSYEDVSIIDKNLTFQPIASGFEFPTGMSFLGINDILVIEKIQGM
jgi:hypothetical protein